MPQDPLPPDDTELSPPTVRNVRVELSDLDERGYHESFRALPGGLIVCDHCGHEMRAADVEIIEVRRLEGQSDPADEAAVVALQCMSCEREGAIVLTYGPQASEDDAEVLLQLDSRGWAEHKPSTASQG